MRSLISDGLKLCDFGISRMVEETGSKVREILGTPDYVAPEVCVLIRCMLLWSEKKTQKQQQLKKKKLGISIFN